MPKNQISATISDQTLAQIETKISEIRQLLSPYLVNLTPEERTKLPKMSDKSVSFVSKVMEYIKTNPDLIPPMMDKEEMEKDFKLNQSLQPVFKILKQLSENVSETLMLTGHEAYAQALLYYATVKMAAKTGSPDAKTIQEDLGKRFAGQGKTKKTPPKN
ncbi:hypothetical protein [Bergeyella cardium]|uniref:Uncharacterized protein n=1 Tax=Bergeyella cardium TaxID=1585976 RepID=A0A6P1QX17_9FLAO|nr:hypothetical protein [Bergeyella cardium]QHN65687.1 hypothetical protein DBX24_07225 [Bergeyella cardium]WHE33276.1 hypothetical protein P8603_07270 [Bergeyella cardium]WHF59925.1 hypothetical protein O0R51_07265 [Bergeyella cardium]